MDLVRDLVSKEVLKTPRIVQAFKKIDRKDFVPKNLERGAYIDEPLPIGEGQTISQPYTVAFMLELLQPSLGDIVLDVGFGSGWQTSLLASIVGGRGKVYAYERVYSIYKYGRKNIQKYGFISDGRVNARCGDGTKPLRMKFDKIIVAASTSNDVPRTWFDALKIGGRMVVPIDNVIRFYIKKTDDSFEQYEYPGFAFVPLLQGVSGQFARVNIIRSTLLIFSIVFISSALGLGVISPPEPIGVTPLSITKGMTAEDIAGVLKERNVIRSRILFVWVTYLGGKHEALAFGKFTFNEPLSVFNVLGKLLEKQKEVVLQIPEGARINDITLLLRKNSMSAYSRFDEVTQYGNQYRDDIPEGKSLEGFLFPDTYRFFESADAEDIVQIMLENFGKKIEPFLEDIEKSDYSLYEIITMASIIEREVYHIPDKHIVSGILWKRLRDGMLLQVDATLHYENGKTSAELTLDDLTADTPYNTYVHLGLPPGPIGSPGEASIEAALFPEVTPYYFYLSDSDGVTHYAETFEKHKENKFQYLR